MDGTETGWGRPAEPASRWRALLDRARHGSRLEEEHPEEQWHTLQLVLVDDRPGVEEDRAHMLAVGDGGEARVVLTRDASGDWVSERVE